MDELCLRPRHGAGVKRFARFMKNVQVTDGCWLWTGTKDDKGYGVLPLGKGIKGHEGAHRFAYRAFCSAIPPGKCVLHTCDNPPCVNPDHLWVGTQLENIQDMDRKGRRRAPKGEKSGMAKLTTGRALEIRELSKHGETLRSLAKKFGVTMTTVWNVVHRKTWVHV